jgi:tRNA A-37 threonylcarbamoyl transferase component Bud32
MNGKKVVVKRNKLSKNLHDNLLVFSYSILSILLAHPSAPPELGSKMMLNEGFEMRQKLQLIGIPTPSLISITSTLLIEDFIPGGNLYQALSNGGYTSLAFSAGIITGRLHKSGFTFIDNKSQNYLVTFSRKVLRTDLAFIQKKDSIFARSMDIGSFLGSLLGLDSKKYKEIENAFYAGYYSEVKTRIPYLSIILRNMLGFGLSLSSNWIKNILQDSDKLMSYRRKFGFSVESP